MSNGLWYSSLFTVEALWGDDIGREEEEEDFNVVRKKKRDGELNAVAMVHFWGENPTSRPHHFFFMTRVLSIEIARFH